MFFKMMWIHYQMLKKNSKITPPRPGLSTCAPFVVSI
jgi:hypothetical protein